MSETTRKLRERFSSPRINEEFLDHHAIADAIEAVEAQVAEAVARVAALEKRQGKVTDDRGPGSAASTVAPASPPAPSAVPAPELWHRATQGFVSCAPPTDMWPHEPPSSAFAAPAEDAGLVERLAEVWIKSVDPKLSWPTGASDPVAVRRGTRGILAAMTAESIRCAPGEVARLTKERDEARAISAATAERVRNETQIATELRNDLADANDRITSQSRSIEEMHAELAEAHKWRDDLRAKLAAAEQALDVERRTTYRPDGERLVHATFEARLARNMAHREALTTIDALRAELVEAKNECDELEEELDALKAKPRFRTRKVTAADVRALDDEWAKSKYVGRDSWVRAMRKLGFRRRVEQSK